MKPGRAFGALIMVGVLSAAWAQEKKIQKSALPASVRKAVLEQAQGAIIKGYSTEIENGKKVYEAEMIVAGHSKDIQIAPDGSVTEVEEEVVLGSPPEPVRAGLIKRSAGAKITKVESLSKQGQLVAYEAQTLKVSHKSEVQVGPDGGKLSHEE